MEGSDETFDWDTLQPGHSRKLFVHPQLCYFRRTLRPRHQRRSQYHLPSDWMAAAGGLLTVYHSTSIFLPFAVANSLYLSFFKPFLFLVILVFQFRRGRCSVWSIESSKATLRARSQSPFTNCSNATIHVVSMWIELKCTNSSKLEQSNDQESCADKDGGGWKYAKCIKACLPVLEE